MRRASALCAGVLALTLATLGDPAPAASVRDLDDVRERRRAVEQDLDDATLELQTLATRIADARTARRRLAHDVRELEAEAAEAREALRQRALTAYMAGAPDPVRLLLGSADAGNALARSRALTGLGHRERRMIERAEAARTALAQRREALDAVVRELAADEARAEELRGRLEVAFDEVAAQEQALESRRSRQRRVSRGGQDGVYACPIAGPFHFRDTWGAPRSGGRRHKGVDIFGRMGADVYAITDGTILRHSHSRLGGIGLYLAGVDGNQYYYAHLQEILPAFAPGTRVEAGQLIARNGSSGNADAWAPHIHMEIRPGGGAHVNPYPYAAAACY